MEKNMEIKLFFVQKVLNNNFPSLIFKLFVYYYLTHMHRYVEQIIIIEHINTIKYINLYSFELIAVEFSAGL